jgi:hypothetical protein
VRQACRPLTEGKHHARIARHAEQPTVPDTNDDKREQHDSAVFAEYVDLWLQVSQSTVAEGYYHTSICRTGCPTSLSTVLSKSCTEKRRHKMRKKPNTEEQMIEVRTPIGALQLAFLVSSLRCADASNPVIVY